MKRDTIERMQKECVMASEEASSQSVDDGEGLLGGNHFWRA
jgi:hypothetical protein